jgi:hypothetical protein
VGGGGTDCHHDRPGAVRAGEHRVALLGALLIITLFAEGFD